jgi:hypothetical protein
VEVAKQTRRTTIRPDLRAGSGFEGCSASCSEQTPFGGLESELSRDEEAKARARPGGDRREAGGAEVKTGQAAVLTSDSLVYQAEGQWAVGGGDPHDLPASRAGFVHRRAVAGELGTRSKALQGAIS